MVTDRVFYARMYRLFHQPSAKDVSHRLVPMFELFPPRHTVPPGIVSPLLSQSVLLPDVVGHYGNGRHGTQITKRHDRAGTFGAC
jgi:hypothetical protein